MLEQYFLRPTTVDRIRFSAGLGLDNRHPASKRNEMGIQICHLM
jgi:hypothetical protein